MEKLRKIHNIQTMKEIQHLCTSVSHIHNFSFGVLWTYFDLQKEISRNAVKLVSKQILFLPKKKKCFVFKCDKNDLLLLKDLQKDAIIYSIDYLPLSKWGKCKEVLYDLDVVFSSTSYSSARKRHHRIVYPFRWIEKNNVKIDLLSYDNFNKVLNLYSSWVEEKMKTCYRIMFPTARYLRCCKACLSMMNFDNNENSSTFFRTYLFSINDVLLAARAVYVEKDSAYDLAFFGDQKSAPSQFMNYINVWLMKELHKNGIRYFNCGYSLNKSLKTFKTHYPSSDVIFFSYSRINSKEVKKKISTILL